MASQQGEGLRLESGGEFRIVLITAPDDETAARLARGLVEAGLAACVNRIGGVSSTYRWRGEIEEDGEVLLVVKTLAARVEALAAWLVEAHPYEVPECVVIEPSAVESAYARWWSSACHAAEDGDGGG